MKRWISAMRLRTLPLAASCILAGSSAAWTESSNPWPILIWGLLTTFLLQILSNLANDYGDFAKGTDNANRVGPERAMQSGAISKKEMQAALAIVALACLASGMLLLHTALTPRGMFVQAIVFLILGLFAILAAFRYTVGRNPYGYRGLGDIFVFLFFGMVGVCGIAFLHTGRFDPYWLLPAMTTGLFSAGVLNLNNLRDHENDKASGKMTMVVKMGFLQGKIYHATLMGIGVMSGLLWTALYAPGLIAMGAVVPLSVQIRLVLHVFKTDNPADLDPELKKVALLTFATALLWFAESAAL
jgi:1,4-dihydroxy-2-naphthoate octaprenyltransferase